MLYLTFSVDHANFNIGVRIDNICQNTGQPMMKSRSAVQSQHAVTADFTSGQLVQSDFAEQS